MDTDIFETPNSNTVSTKTVAFENKETIDPTIACSSKDKTFLDTVKLTASDLSLGEHFLVSKQFIPCVPINQQEPELVDLGVSVYDQSLFENEVLGQVDRALKAQEAKQKKFDAQKELHFVEEDIKFVKQRLNQIEKAVSMSSIDSNLITKDTKEEISAITKEQESKLKHLKKLEEKHSSLQVYISRSVDTTVDPDLEVPEGSVNEKMLHHIQDVFSSKETEKERLIRTGKMTPFGTRNSSVPGQSRPKPPTITISENRLTDFDKFLLKEADNHLSKKTLKKSLEQRKLAKPLASEIIKPELVSAFKSFTDLKAVPRKKKRVKVKLGSMDADGFSKKKSSKRSLIKNYKSDSEISDFEINEDEFEINDNVNNYSDDDVYIPEKNCSFDSDSDYSEKVKPAKKKKHLSPHKNPECKLQKKGPVKSKVKRSVDDGNISAYMKRIKAARKAELVQRHKKIMESKDGVVDSDEDEYTEFNENYRIPNSIWNKLYLYQQTCVRWLWELHQQNCGGIIGDEMGLGKTIQIIAFLCGLNFSKLQILGDSFQGLGPVILVCPATIMHQWVKEFHTWWPHFRVAVLHASGSFSGKKESLIRSIIKNPGVLITSYAGVVQHHKCLLEYEWHYIILDEGHKIRNPNARATLVVKQFRTPHRIILSGSPIQNNLKELWSLFDFIFPGKLGTLPVFMEQFSVPIVLGGYANASQVQIQIAYKCATVLRDTISPYLLRRLKSDVKMSINLPNKNEQVLFCQMSEEQINLYKGYVDSKEVSNILSGRFQVFVGLINLRKICNHPDLFDGGPKIFKDTDISKLNEEEKFGYYKRSGKMIVVEALLRLWHNQGHKVLLFTQSRQMMDILELFVKSRNYAYMKMDGMTSIASRQPAIAKFNTDPNMFVFLLTTRVGGLGVNLTGANRVILYDPDWNPSTDSQARERAWRIGQLRQVTIYRLITAGTIEEKIYHRQIFKQFLTNRILKDPKQRRFFKSNDLCELFTYNELGKQGTETSAIFASTGSVINPENIQKHNKNSSNTSSLQKEEENFSISFNDEKREKMRLLAKKLSSELLKKVANTNPEASKPVESETVTEQNALVKKQDSAQERGKSFQVEPNKKVSKKKKRKAARVEGKKIDFVIKRKTYKPTESAGEKDLKQDDYVLSKLFKTSGVHSALEHDKILECSDPDYMIVENEANRVANEAVIALKNSRRLCAPAETGIPTWTGLHGGSKKPRFGQKLKLPPGIASTSDEASKTLSKTPPPKPIFGGQKFHTSTVMSSSDLLSTIRKRKAMLVPDEESDSETTVPVRTVDSEYDELLGDIRTFIAFGSSVNGQATTKEILETFKSKVPTKQTAIFRALLTKICDFSRASSGEGIWYLKGEFK